MPVRRPRYDLAPQPKSSRRFFAVYGTHEGQEFITMLPASSAEEAENMAKIMFSSSEKTPSFGVAEAHVTLFDHKTLRRPK